MKWEAFKRAWMKLIWMKWAWMKWVLDGVGLDEVGLDEVGGTHFLSLDRILQGFIHLYIIKYLLSHLTGDLYNYNL
jgi:hypothetical protein